MRISDWSSDVCSSDLQSLSKQPMLPQAMAQLIVSQSQRFGGRALVETMLIERRLQNRHFMRIDSGAEITDVIKRLGRSEERSVGKEGVSTGRHRWSPCH